MILSVDMKNNILLVRLFSVTSFASNFDHSAGKKGLTNSKADSGSKEGSVIVAALARVRDYDNCKSELAVWIR